MENLNLGGERVYECGVYERIRNRTTLCLSANTISFKIELYDVKVKKSYLLDYSTGYVRDPYNPPMHLSVLALRLFFSLSRRSCRVDKLDIFEEK